MSVTESLNHTTSTHSKAEWFIVIDCPACHLKQAFVNSGKPNNIWYCFAPYCCDAMRHSDDVVWNAKLDKAIERELYAARQ